MNPRWEIKRVSTSERILDKIKTEMAQPVGIMICGADCEFKNEVVNEIECGLPGLVSYDNTISALTLAGAVQDCSMVAVILTTDESALHILRHGTVKVMRNAGAKSVVGIYVKSNCIMNQSLREQVEAIERTNPTADGLDYLVVITEERG